MLFERKFETRTHGLVCGVPTLVGEVFQPLFIKRSQVVIGDAKPRLFTSPASAVHWKVVIESREGREILWQRPFEHYDEAIEVYRRLIGVEPTDRGMFLPSTWLDGELTYYIATVATYNSSNSTAADWPTGNKCPSGVTSTDYLVVAGGGSGGSTNAGGPGGGGGAGGMKASTGMSVTPGNAYTITVGTGGASVTSGLGNAGNNSVFNTVTSDGGGKGGSTSSVNGGNGGSGGGSGYGSTAGTTTGGSQGNDGAVGSGASQGTGGGGGGAGAAGTAGGASAAGPGGNGSASSISGSSVTYAGGGGGGAINAGTKGAGGTGGGGAGGQDATTAVDGTAGTANLGGGGGGSGATKNVSGGGGAGVIILSFTLPTLPKSLYPPRRMPRFYTRRF